MKNPAEKLVIAKMPMKGKETICSVSFDRDKRPLDFRIDIQSDEPKPGEIYVGQVELAGNGSGGIFVRIGKQTTAYLPEVSERTRKYLIRKSSGEDLLKAGEVLLVQVDNAALKTKLPRVSGILKIPGRYMVLTTDGPGIGYSRNLTQEERERIHSWICGLRRGTDSRQYGMIVRTESRNADPESFQLEYERLYAELEQICERGLFRNLYSRIHAGTAGWRYLYTRMPKDGSDVVTDIPDLFERISQGGNSRFYDDPMLPLYKLYGFEKLLEHVTNRTVWLKSGASIVIEETEAFVVVDVNSGKRIRKKGIESAPLEVNLEAADQIFREIRLRELSGIILIDFINLKDPKEERSLLEYLRLLAEKDPRKIRVVDITPLGICELTREKKDASVRQKLMELEKKK